MSKPRPFYETRNDLQNELDALRKIAVRTTPVKLPLRYEIDFAMVDGDKICAFAEVKCRTNPFGQYPTLMISAAKLISGITLSGMTGCPFWLIVQWTDKVGALEVDSISKWRMSIGGRRDRGDDQDIEPVVHIPTTAFKILTTIEATNA